MAGSEREMTSEQQRQLTNFEIAVYALYLEGGASRPVNTEDIALKAFELAPDSFSWVRHPQYPDKDIARVALTDARKEQHGALVKGRAGRGKGLVGATGAARRSDGWQLTEAGVEWTKGNEERLVRRLGQSLPKTHRQEALAKLGQVRKHPLFGQFLSKPQGYVPTLGALAELLRCRVDAGPPVWRERFHTLRNLAVQAEQQDVVEFLSVCEKFIEESA